MSCVRRATAAAAAAAAMAAEAAERSQLVMGACGSGLPTAYGSIDVTGCIAAERVSR